MLREVSPYEHKNQHQKTEGRVWISKGGRTVPGGAGAARGTLVGDVIFEAVKQLKGRGKSVSIITSIQMIISNCLSKILLQ